MEQAAGLAQRCARVRQRPGELDPAGEVRARRALAHLAEQLLSVDVERCARDP
jgi:hypothetical protein